MKHKWIKRTAIVAAICIAAGGIGLGAGLALGGSPLFYYDGKTIHTKENSQKEGPADHVLEQTKTGTIRSLYVYTQSARVELVTGSGFSLEYRLDGHYEAPEWSAQNGVLTFREGSVYTPSEANWMPFDWQDGLAKSTQDPYVKITLPEGTDLSEVQIETQSGDLEVRQLLQAKLLDVDVKFGDVSLDGWKGDEAVIQMECGQLLADSLTGKRVDIENQYGDVRLSSLDADAKVIQESGGLYAMLEAERNLDAQVEYGNVVITPVGSLTDYGLSLHTLYGTIRTASGVMMRADGWEEDVPETDYVSLTEGSATIRVYTEEGDIQIR